MEKLQTKTAWELAQHERARLEAARVHGSCESGIGQLDGEVLLGGGFERAKVVGVSCEDEQGFGMALGLQVVARAVCSNKAARALVVTTEPRATVADAVRAAVRREAKEVGDGVERRCLESVLVSCVFDVEGVGEVLDEFRQQRQQDQRRRKEVLEIGDSQDQQDDDQQDDDQDGDNAAPSIVLIARFSCLLAGLFAQRPADAVHAVLNRLGRQMRRVTRGPGQPLLLLLNSTTGTITTSATANTAATTTAATLRSLLTARCKPAYGLAFSRLLDLHLLASSHPPLTALEVLLDEQGLWCGHGVFRPCREQRSTFVRLVAGRVVDATAPNMATSIIDPSSTPRVEN
ncbi:hypothetical protein CDD82_4978 [Ophiocordyceps australis]|uniref:DNA recombination and repair protein Rad51-like C-terminal domain-containing protein n=1 Tax=Ophiocordyceps australis TaxID=1399860 RepID=A0A2C5XJ68_9HYPO|nr:hypothetical protein CDD82_4978 [Ophiocordyceps australis]